MLKVKLIAVGKCKEEWLRQAIAEYEKRLSSSIAIEWIHPKNDNDLIERLACEKQYIALDPAGELMDSVEFSKKFIRLIENNRSQAIFAIGGPDGFPPHLKPPLRWSLSRLTFTHQLTRLILIEQLYRALEIVKNSPYHK